MDCIAFAGETRIAKGAAADVARAAKLAMQGGESVLVFDARTSRPVEFDFRGSPDEVARRAAKAYPAEPAAEEEPRGRGRPRLGVVGREVTLLPRHWEWLAAQPGGASVALRKLVEAARKANAKEDAVRAAQESAYRFMSAMAGDAAHFEEASRALFAGDRTNFQKLTRNWPRDVRAHARALADAAFAPGVAA
jgi:hypothetical protein